MDYQNDFLTFKQSWETAYKMYGKEAPDLETTSAVFNLCAQFPLQTVIKAIEHHLQTNEFLIKPCHIFQYAQKVSGDSEEQIKSKAQSFYDNYLMSLDSNADLVIESDLFAVCFSQCFRSVRDFMRRANSDYAVSKDREYFVNTALAYKKSHLPDEITHVFTGNRNFLHAIKVSFAGDYDTCKELAVQYYMATGEIHKFHLDFPPKTMLRLPNKPQEFSEEHKKQSVDYMDKLINDLQTKIKLGE